MNITKEFQDIIKEYLESASEEEAKELFELLKKREEKLNLHYNVDVSSMAKEMAKKIHDQIGFTTENVKTMAVELVKKMAREKEPNITERELDQLVELMVPDREKKIAKIPPVVIYNMVEQFISFSQGTMAANMIAELPQGWVEKYWDFFPEVVQKLIRAYIKEEITEKDFWGAIQKVLHLEHI